MKRKTRKELEQELKASKVAYWIVSIVSIIFILGVGFLLMDRDNSNEEKAEFQEEFEQKNSFYSCVEIEDSCDWVMYNARVPEYKMCSSPYYKDRCQRSGGDYCIFGEWKVYRENYSFTKQNCEEIVDDFEERARRICDEKDFCVLANDTVKNS